MKTIRIPTEIQIVLLLITIIFVLIVWPATILNQKFEKREQDEYRVYIKETGNPKELTFEEWKLKTNK